MTCQGDDRSMSWAYSKGRRMIWGEANGSWVVEPSPYMFTSRGRTVTRLHGSAPNMCVSIYSYSGGGIGSGKCPFMVDTYLMSGKKMTFLGFEILVM